MRNLKKLLEQLKDVPVETTAEPELKHNRREQDKKLREEQDLAAGAVLEATVREGSGSSSPADGDLVFVHVTIRAPEEDEAAADAAVVYSTKSEEGGPGQPLAFRLGKGWRAPRSWELALAGMTVGGCKALVVKPSYGYRHPDCAMAAPPGVPADAKLHFTLELVHVLPGSEVLSLGDGNVYKTTLQDSEAWENPRPPTEISFSVEARCLAYDGRPGTGFLWHSTPDGKPVRIQMGTGQLPAGLAAALGQMSVGEVARYIVPAETMREAEECATAGAEGSGRQSEASTSGRDSATAAGAGAAAANGKHTTSSSSKQQAPSLLLPVPPKGATQVELTVYLFDLVQVRDLTGDGGVTKRRLRPGDGEFPMDCPLRDTTVTLHYRVRQAGTTATAAAATSGDDSSDGGWLYDSCRAAAAAANGDAPAASSNGSSSAQQQQQPPWAPGWGGAAGAVTVDTGCGELPEGLEMCSKLMVPLEVARVIAAPKYGYQGRSDVPPGVEPDRPVEFEVQLVSFVKEGFWQNLGWEERWALAERLKAKGNQLYSQHKFDFAINRYKHMLQLLESTRDYEEDSQVTQVEALKLAALSNLAAAALAQGEGARAVEWCDKGLDLSPDNAKLLLRKSKALTLKGDFEEAEQQLATLEGLEGAAGLAAEVAAARTHNKQKQRAASQKQKGQFKSFFSS